MYQEGYDCFAASLGTALTIEQARLINRYDKKIILSFDNDDAGKTATLRALDIFAKLGTEPSVIMIPDGKDPDGYIKKYGSKKFQELVDNAYTPVEYKIGLIRNRYSSENTQDRVKLFRELIKILAEIDDMTQIDMYASKYARELNITKDAILNDVNRKRGNREDTGTGKSNKELENSDLDKKNEYEMMMLLLYFNHKTAKDKIKKYFEGIEDTDSRIYRMYDLIFNSAKDVMFSDILEITEKGNIAAVIKMNEKIENIDNKEKAFEDFMKRLNDIKLEAFRSRIKSIDDLKEYEKMRKPREEV